jgi:hypothetical protein
LEFSHEKQRKKREDQEKKRDEDFLEISQGNRRKTEEEDLSKSV